MSASTPNAFLNIDDAHLRVTSGNVYAQGLNISGVSFSGVSGLQTITNTGNVTTNTLEFKNGAKAFVATSNVEVKGSLDVANVATIYNGSNADYDQKQKFTSTVSSSGNYFANTLAISTNGLYAIVGAHGENKTYTFTRTGSTWTQEHTFSSTAGYAVDISSDGTYAIVGANGSAFVFYRSSGSTWDSGTTLTAGGISVTTGYGASVSISDDGSYAIVGATGQSAAYIFRRTGTTTWDAGVKIALTGFSLGFSVAISGDGLYALLGAHAQHTAYVFKRSGAYLWSQQAKITESDSFGYSVALSTDGSRALIGATDGNGKAYSYERSGSGWSQNAIITASDGASGDAFGSAVSLSSDGSYGIVGAPGIEKVYTFKNAGSVWTELGIETASDATTGHVFGRSVSISGDGIYALIGASGNEAAYSYERKETLVLDVRGEANVRTLNVSENVGVGGELVGTGNITANSELIVSGNLHVTTIRSDSNVVAEYTGPHDRPLRKYPEVAMTSASQGGYVVDQSTARSSTYYGWKAFDQDETVLLRWQSDDNTFSSSSPHTWSGNTIQFTDTDGGEHSGEWIKLKLPKKIKLEHIIFKTWYPSYTPKDFVILGSNDDTNWKLLKTVTDHSRLGSDGDLIPHKHIVNATTKYDYYVLLVSETNSSHNTIITELEYYGHEEGSASLDTTLKSVYNVPATTGTQLEVYYDGRETSSYSGSGTTVTDLAGTQQNGTFNGGFDPTYKAFTFNGTSQNMTTTLANSGTPSAYAHTFAFWTKPISNLANHTQQAFLQMGTHSSNSCSALRIEESTGNFRWFFHGNDIRYSADHIIFGEWNHIVAAYDGGSELTSRRIWVNGYEIHHIASETPGALSLSANAPLTIGSQIDGSSDFNGSIANFRLYSKALNAGQIQELYDYQKDYFLGSKSQVTLYKGHLGVGVTEPSGQLELTGDERIQEYPPRAFDGGKQRDVGPNEVYIGGHGHFKAWTTAEYGDGQRYYEAGSAFNKKSGEGSDNQDRWVSGRFWTNGPNASSGASTGLPTASAPTFAGYKGAHLILELPYAINLKSFIIGASGQGQSSYDTHVSQTASVFVIIASNDGNNWDTIFNHTATAGVATDYIDTAFSVNVTKAYSQYGYVALKNGNTSTDDHVTVGEWRLFGTPGPTTLDKGSLSLTRSLDVPRVSRYDVDTETPRPEKIVLDYDTTKMYDAAGTGSYYSHMAIDNSGNRRDGNFRGATGNKYCAPEKAFQFIGNGYLQTAEHIMSGNPPMSQSLWFNYTGTGTETLYSITAGYGTNAVFWVYVANVDSVPKVHVDFSANVVNFTDPNTGSTAIGTNQWYHLVVTYDGNSTIGGRKCYINGVEQVSSAVFGGSANGTLSLGSSRVTLGALDYTATTGLHHMIGYLGNFKIYDAILEPSEVRKLYRLGRTGRSMVISDTAVGIGREPEVALDVRGTVRFDNAYINNIYSPSLLAHQTCFGGGIVSFNGSTTRLRWSSDILMIPSHKETSNGSMHIRIRCPANGEKVNYYNTQGAHSLHTVNSAGIALAGWQSLWFTARADGPVTSTPDQFMIMDYYSPRFPVLGTNSILIAVRFADGIDNELYFPSIRGRINV